MRPLKFKLKHILAKQFMCERLLVGGQLGYGAVVPELELIEESQEALKTIRQEKQALRQENAAMTKEIGALLEQIIGSQQDLQDTIKELSSFGEDSPYIPTQSISHFSQPEEAQQQPHLLLALERLESRIAEAEEHQKATSIVSGFQLTNFSNNGASFSFDIAAHCSALLPSVTASAISSITQSSSLTLNMQWNEACHLTEVNISPLPFAAICSDVLEAGREDNSPSFILREVSHRILCFFKRHSHLEAYTRQGTFGLSSKTPSTSTGTTFEFNRVDEPLLVIRLSIPMEYPSSNIRINNVMHSNDGTVTASCAALKTKRFASIDAALEAASLM